MTYLIPDGFTISGLVMVFAAAVTSRVAIRMAPDIESLNVAVAAGILLHSLRVR